VLRSFVLAGDDDAGRHVGQADGGFGFVDVLPARAAGAVSIDAQILFVDRDVDFFINDRRDGDGAETGVPARV